MALALDSSTPAAVTNSFGGSASQTITTASFTPPGGSVIVVTAQGFCSWTANTTCTFSDSLGALAWTTAITQSPTSDPNNRNAVFVGWAYAGASSPGALTVSATLTIDGGQFFYDTQLCPLVFAGANTSGPLGASGHGAVTTAALSVALTPQATGSALILAASKQVDSTIDAVASTLGSGMVYIADYPASGGTGYREQAIAWLGSNATTPTLTASTSAQTLALTAPDTSTSYGWQYIGFEVLGSAGPDTTPPSVPANLRTTSIGSTSVGLAWDASTDNVAVTGYELTTTGLA